MNSSDTLQRYQNLQSQRDQLSQNLAQDTKDGGALPQMLKDSINQRYNNFNNVLQDEADARMNLYNAPTDAQVRYQNVFNPFVRGNLEAKAVNLAQNRYDVARGVRNGIFDTLDNIIGQGVNGYNSMLQGKKMNLDNLNQQSQEALSLYGTQRNGELQQQALDMQRQAAAVAQQQADKLQQQQQAQYESKISSTLDLSDQHISQLKQLGGQLKGSDTLGNQTWYLPVSGRTITLAPVNVSAAAKITPSTPNNNNNFGMSDLSNLLNGVSTVGKYVYPFLTNNYSSLINGK